MTAVLLYLFSISMFREGVKAQGIKNFWSSQDLFCGFFGFFFFVRRKKLGACLGFFDVSVKKLIGGQHNPTVIFFAYCISVSGDAYLNVNFMHAKIK